MHRPTRLRHVVGVLVPLALLAGACGGEESDPALDVDTSAQRCPVGALDDAAEPVEIDFWHAMTAANADTLEQLTEEYNASQDQVVVNPLFQGVYDEVSDKLVNSLQGGDVPEIVQLEETRIRLGIDSRAMLPVQACIDAADYDLSDHLPSVVDQFTVEDVLWPMPFNVSSPLLYANLQSFEAAGLTEADIPTTLDEMVEVSRTIVESGAAPYALALELQPAYIEQWIAMAGEPFVDNENGRSGRETETNLDSEVAAEVYEFLDTMLSEGLAKSVGRNPQGSEHFLSVGSGESAMTIGTSAALGTVLGVIGDFPNVTMEVAPLPGADEGGVVVGGAALWLLDEGTSPEEKAAAWDYVAWLNEPEQQAAWHAGTGYIPIRQSAVELPAVADLWAETPEMRVAYDQILASEAEYGGPVIGDYGAVREVLVESMERLALGEGEATEILADAEQRAEDAIQSYNERVGG